MDDGLIRQYDRAVDEYRFQVDLNWRRSEYFFVLNVGVLIASATMFSSGDVPPELVAVLFFVGTLLAGLSFLANGVQHGYYQAARNRKHDLENRLDLRDVALTTTPGMGSKVSRLGRVGTFLKVMLVAIALADLTGAGFAIAEAAGDSGRNASASSVVVNLEPSSDKTQDWLAVVVSHNGEVIRSRGLRRRQASLTFSLEPGRYLISAGGSSVCQRRIRVSSAPLQLIDFRC